MAFANTILHLWKEARSSVLACFEYSMSALLEGFYVCNIGRHLCCGRHLCGGMQVKPISDILC